MNITLYTTGCPKCKVLAAKLESANLFYNTSSNVEEIIEMGFTEAPVLQVENEYYSFMEAIKWIGEQNEH